MQSRLRKRGRKGKWSYTHTIRKQVFWIKRNKCLIWFLKFFLKRMCKSMLFVVQIGSQKGSKVLQSAEVTIFYDLLFIIEQFFITKSWWMSCNDYRRFFRHFWSQNWWVIERIIIHWNCFILFCCQFWRRTAQKLVKRNVLRGNTVTSLWWTGKL